MSDCISGEGPWRVTFHDGHVVLVEIWAGNRRVLYGVPRFSGTCARCGTPIPVFTPDNATMEVCQDCELAILRDIAAEEAQ